MASPSGRSKLTPLLLGAALLIVIGLVIAAVFLSGRQPAAPVPRSAADPAARAEIDAALESASYLIRTREIDKAAVILEKLLAAYPDEPEGHVLLAQVLIFRNQTGPALDHLIQSLELDSTQDEVHHLVGTLYARTGEPEKAEHHYRRAIALNSADSEYPLYLGRLLLERDQLDEAQMQLLTAARLDADRPETHAMLAETSARRGKPDMAIQQINRAIDLTAAADRKHLAYLLQKTVYLRRANQPDDALQLLDALPAEQRRSPAVVDHRAATHQMLGRHDLAARCWADLYASDPANAHAAAQAGLCLVRAADLAQARQWLMLAREADHRDPAVQALQLAIEKAESSPPDDPTSSPADAATEAVTSAPTPSPAPEKNPSTSP